MPLSGASLKISIYHEVVPFFRDPVTYVTGFEKRGHFVQSPNFCI